MFPKIQILSNTNYALADVIKSELVESSSVKIAVAFLRKTGLEHIYKSLDYALKSNKAQVEFIVGLDFKTTDAEALFALSEIKENNENFNFYCFGDKRDNHNDLVFHPKIYMFDTQFSKSSKYTSIVGSSNFTGGGLTTNFEVNTVFRELKPHYYNQLGIIYDEIKFQDSIFKPSKNYIKKYGNIKEEIDKTVEKVVNTEIKNEIVALREEEKTLEGATPPLKKIIIEIIKEQLKFSELPVSIDFLYVEAKKRAIEKKVKIKNMETFDNTLRGELNKHEQNSNHPDNMGLFVRMGKGLYTLTEKGKNYGENEK